MGLLSWWKGSGSQIPSAAAAPPKPNPKQQQRQQQDSSSSSTASAGEVPGMNGAEEIRRPSEVTVFEFGSAAASGDNITVAGYCPVSDDLEPCRWQILPASGSDAPQFRVVF